VNKVIAMMGGGATATTATTTTTTRTSSGSSSRAWIDSKDARIPDASKAIVYASTWRTARYPTYSARQVTYSTRKGATATYRFSGRGIAWVAPVGPTRGTARVYLDGRQVATVDLRRSSFRARSIVFARSLPAGQHTLRILVTSSGRPVAIDELIVGR
jgi:hypothetical protein